MPWNVSELDVRGCEWSRCDDNYLALESIRISLSQRVVVQYAPTLSQAQWPGPFGHPARVPRIQVGRRGQESVTWPVERHTATLVSCDRALG